MSTRAHEPRVGLDTQCLSYLLDAIAGIGEPTDSLAEERKALVRIWLYCPWTYYLTETVVTECAQIHHVERREFHASFIQTLFLDLPVQNVVSVEARTSELLSFHAKRQDCQVLAEAEDLELNTLLTYDHQFLRRLGPQSHIVKLATPSSYWLSLGIARGTRPKTVPHLTNPLSAQSWWRW